MIAHKVVGSQQLERLAVEQVRALWGRLAAVESGEAAEQLALEWSRALGRRVLEAGLQARLEAVEAEADRGCTCGARLGVHSRQARTVLTLLGAVRLRRRYLRCGRCGAHRFAADEWLGWERGFSRLVQEAVAWQAAAMPYRQALAGLRKLAGVELSLGAAQKIVACWGAEELRPQPYAERVKGRLAVQVDGTTAHLEDGWREVKVAALMQWRRGKPGKVTYVADWLPAEQFAEPLWREGLARGAPCARQIAVIADGAPWIWELARFLFPRSTQILDWYHACEHLWAAAQTVHGEESPETLALVERWKNELWHGYSEGLEDELRELAGCAHDPDQVLRRVADYLTTHQARLRYPLFRAAGWPLASGVVEGGCKHVIDLRFKRKSTRWKKPGARAVLRLRLDILNDRWENRRDHLRQAA